MKNLKKVLSLVLALAMALSLMTVAFAKDAADFADYDEVNYKEAVDVMVAAGIFDGTGNNNFSADVELTREQAAKIITYMLVGQEKADKLTTTVAPYADVAADRWSAGAIAYCTNEGILAGAGDGKFYPTAKLDGLAFSKMLLTALGYDAAIEKLTGASWAINAAKLAINAELDDGMEEVSLSDVLTREQAAQMALNAMKADIVDYDNRGTELKLVDGTIVIVGASKAEAVESDKDWADNIVDDGTVQFAEMYCRDLTLADNADADTFGRPAHTWAYDAEDIGTYADEAYATYASADFEDVLADLADDKDIVTNAATTYTWNADPISNLDELDTLNAGDIKGATVELYVTKKVITDVVVTHPYVVTVDSIGVDDDETTVTLKNLSWAVADLTGATPAAPIAERTIVISSEDNEDAYAMIKDYAEEDVFVAIFDRNDFWENDANDFDADSLLAVDDVETVTGKVTAVSTDWVKVDGQKYEYARAYSGETIALDAENGTFYLYNGYLMHYAGEDASTNYAVVVATKSDGWTNETVYQAKLLMPNGTVETVEVEDNAAGMDNKIVTYTKDSKGVYTLTATEQGNTTADANNELKIENGKAAMKLNGVDFTATSKTQFFFYDSEAEEFEVYTGVKNVPSVSDAGTYYYSYVATGKIMKAVFVSNAGDIKDGASSEVASYFFKTTSEEEVNDTDLGNYFVVKAVVDGKPVEVMMNANAYAQITSGRNIVSKITKDENDIITNVVVETRFTVDTEGDGYIEGMLTIGAAEDDVLTIDGNGYTYDNAVVYQYSIADDKFTKKTVESLKDQQYPMVVQLEDNVVVAIYYVVA